jgi:FkbM family methyltransferase
MLKKISLILSKILIFSNKFFFFFFKKNFIYFLQESLRNNSITNIYYEGKKYKFFTPSNLAYWRAKTFDTKEPETLNWIKNFDDNSVFWDIGSNVGTYSIYAAKIKARTQIVAFEPSGLNLGILQKNINLNKLNDKIKIIPFALTKKPNTFLTMFESSEEEGGALSSFGDDKGFDGKKMNFISKYKLFGTSINSIIKNRALKTPNYIKIDVDGKEHIILEGSTKILKNKTLRSLLIEINENYTDQFKKIKKIMKQNSFILYNKFISKHALNSRFDKSFNYIFNKK